MIDFFDIYNEREKSIKNFLNMLSSIETGRTKLKSNKVTAESNFLVMKATFFLLLYNLIESSVKSGFQKIYDEIDTQAVVYNKASQDIKDVWLKQKFKKIQSASATQNTYHDLMNSIALHITKGDTINLSSRNLTISGNLNADKIRKLCREHGVNLVVHYRALGGGELETVKAKRNDLAHGHVSFDECGRDYTVNDLLRIYKEVCAFVRGFLRSLSKALTKSIFITP